MCILSHEVLSHDSIGDRAFFRLHPLLMAVRGLDRVTLASDVPNLTCAVLAGQGSKNNDNHILLLFDSQNLS